MNEKYGFIYVWHNTKKNKFYVGCHWGTEDDGYICSSKAMRNAYAYDKSIFKRRVIQRVYTNRQDLLEAEFKWLDQIKDEELGKKYYNLSKRHFGHWAATHNATSVSERISRKVKQAYKDGRYEASKDKRVSALKRRRYTDKMRQVLVDRNKAPKTKEQCENMKRTGKQNAWTGKIWITNGSESTRVAKDQLIPSGWRKGRVNVHKK